MVDTPETAGSLEGFQMEVNAIKNQFETNTDLGWDVKTSFQKLLQAEQQVAMARASADGSKMTVATADMLKESVEDQEDPALAVEKRIQRYTNALESVNARAQELQRAKNNQQTGRQPIHPDLTEENLTQTIQETHTRRKDILNAITNYQRVATAFAQEEVSDTVTNPPEKAERINRLEEELQSRTEKFETGNDEDFKEISRAEQLKTIVFLQAELNKRVGEETQEILTPEAFAEERTQRLTEEIDILGGRLDEKRAALLRENNDPSTTEERRAEFNTELEDFNRPIVENLKTHYGAIRNYEEAVTEIKKANEPLIDIE